MVERRTIDDLRRKSASRIIELVRTEVHAGIGLCQIAKKTSEPKQIELLNMARRTSEVADQWVWRLRMGHRRLDQLTADLDRLKIEIGSLENHGPKEGEP
jgi:hypothetical protein